LSEKLVRDLIPELIQSRGEEPKVRKASTDELDHLIRAKILEEAGELLDSGSTEEIADVLEAISALIAIRGKSWDEIEKIRSEKLVRRGGFTEGYVLTIEKDT
jgi:predicted house-cleaning noncanonical NTP pyrophosphatase (MazG superfamily)